MYGLNIDPNNPRGNPDPAELRELGLEIVRYTYHDHRESDQLDPSKARFHQQKVQAYHQVGIDSLLILSYDTYPNKPGHDAGKPEWDNYIEKFARRCGQIAQLMAPWQPALQIWNEPDHPPHSGYAPTLREEVFGQMLRRAYDAIKAADSNLFVVAGGLASGDPNWLKRVIQSQGGNLPADAVAIHPYGLRPEQDWPSPDWFFGYVGEVIHNYYRAGGNRPMWITEMGVKEEELDHNREKVAEFLRRYYRTITTYYTDQVQKLIWFCYTDGMVAPFGLLDAAGNRKPAYDVFRKMAVSAPRRRPEPVTPSPQPTTPPSISQPAITQPFVTIAAPPPPAIFTNAPATPTTTPPTPATTPAITPTAINEPSQQFNPQTAQWYGRAKQLQSQIARFQNQLQQLLDQQAQLQNQIQQLQSQPAVGSGSSAGVTPTIPSTTPAGVGRRPVPPIQNITNQLKRHPNLQFPTRSLNQIQRVIIHHTAIPPTVGAERIATHRVDKQGWPGIGYHYFITGDGQIRQTNELTTLSKHAGQYDPVAIGICFAGDFTNASPTPTQIETGAQLIAWLLPQFGLTIAAVSGYKELVITQSPGLQWDSGLRWGDQLRAQIQAYL